MGSAAIAKRIRTRLVQQSAGSQPQWRHVKTGGIYEELGQGNIQSSIPLEDMSEVVIYRGADRRLWARNAGDFHDGRFVRLAQQSPAAGREDQR